MINDPRDHPSLHPAGEPAEVLSRHPEPPAGGDGDDLDKLIKRLRDGTARLPQHMEDARVFAMRNEAADTIARLRERVAELEERAAVHGRRTRSMNSEIARLTSDAACGGAGEIASERQRQKEAEGWTPEHDDQHTDGSLATVAACYIAPGYAKWPKSWSQDWWKPKDRRADLVRAGALIAAEIDRLDRLAVRGGQP